VLLYARSAETSSTSTNVAQKPPQLSTYYKYHVISKTEAIIHYSSMSSKSTGLTAQLLTNLFGQLGLTYLIHLLYLSPLLFHLYIPLWKSTGSGVSMDEYRTALSSISHLVSGMDFPKNFANLSMMSPCHCDLIFLSPVHHHHHHHHFHCSIPDSKLTFSINLSHHTSRSLAFSGGSQGFLWPFPDLIAHLFFVNTIFSSFSFDSCGRLS